MSGETITWIWLIAGIVLIVLEFFAPGLVVSFLGLAAMIVAGLRWLGLFPDLLESFTAWFVISIVLLLGLRHFFLRWIPSERSFQTTDEDLEAIGVIVDVVHEISSGKEGRIRFGGTTWPAVTRHGVIPQGKKARIIMRDNLVWIVEPHLELEEPNKDSSTM